jgi:hypothetical protein
MRSAFCVSWCTFSSTITGAGRPIRASGTRFGTAGIHIGLPTLGAVPSFPATGVPVSVLVFRALPVVPNSHCPVTEVYVFPFEPERFALPESKR